MERSAAVVSATSIVTKSMEAVAFLAIFPSAIAKHLLALAQSSRTTKSSWANRSGSLGMSNSTILSCLIVTPKTEYTLPSGATTMPAAPFTSAGREERVRSENATASPATSRAPRTNREGGEGSAPASALRTTSGSSTSSNASKSGLARGGEERVDDRALPGEIGVRSAIGRLHAPAGATPELPRCIRWSPDDRRDLVERDGEHVVQHERRPLRRREGVEHDEQREPDRVGEQRLVLRIDLLVQADDRVGHVDVQGFLPAW
jgi:hypothetical protein